MSVTPVEYLSVVERKDPSLPRFAVIPATVLAHWALEGTTVVEARLNGSSVGRRSLKPWGRGRDVWFIDLTERHCAVAEIDTGDAVHLELRIAPNDLPEEIETLIAGDPAAAARWASYTPSRQRQLAEHVRSAKQPGTRARRARRALANPRSG